MIRDAQGELLNAVAKRMVFDAEIPREGVRVRGQFERTRWIGGSTLLWVGLRQELRKGEGASRLRLDDAGSSPPVKPRGRRIKVTQRSGLAFCRLNKLLKIVGLRRVDGRSNDSTSNFTSQR